MPEQSRQVNRAGKSGRRHSIVPAPSAIEPLEQRVLLSFNAYMTAPATGGTMGYSVNLYTTGQPATQWTVNWGDGTYNTYNASDYSGGFPTPFSPSHSYSTTGHQTITAQAYDGSEYANASYALNPNFGDYQFAGSGKSVDVPSGYTTIQAGTNGGAPMAVDPSTGDIYVASAVPVSGGGTAFAVTRYLPTGQVDTNAWGTDGTLVLLQASTGSNDVPFGMAIDPSG